MSDDGEEEIDGGVEDGSSERTPGKKNRCSDQVTDLKNLILLLAWNSTSRQPTTDGQGLKEMMGVQILAWLDCFPSQYGNILKSCVASNLGKEGTKAATKKVMEELTESLNKQGGVDPVRLGKKVVSDIHKYLSPHWKDPSNEPLLRLAKDLVTTWRIVGWLIITLFRQKRES